MSISADTGPKQVKCLSNIDTIREAAFKILLKISEKKAYLNIELSNILASGNLTSADRAFITEVVTGTVRYRLIIDKIIEEYSTVKFSKISPGILNILRIGVYQILYMDRTPDSAACNESVNLARRYGHKASANFTNAVLRKISQKNGYIAYPDKNEYPEAFLSLKYSHPEWLIKKWITEFGTGFTENLLEANNAKPRFYIRANRIKTDREGLAKMLLKKGYNTHTDTITQDALIVTEPASITEISEYRDGYFHIQDESSMLAAIIVDPLPGDFVIDTCAAPGGKSTHMAQLMGNTGKILAWDVHRHKLQLIKEAAAREGISIIETGVRDARDKTVTEVAQADKVLVDAPCTGYGVIRRKPDIKWTSDPGEGGQLSKIQTEILGNAASLVKPGGSLVYSTCTIGKEENENVITAFLDKHPDFHTEDISAYLPEGMRKPENKDGIVRLYPNTDNTDGFFIAKMERERIIPAI